MQCQVASGRTISDKILAEADLSHTVPVADVWDDGGLFPSTSNPNATQALKTAINS